MMDKQGREASGKGVTPRHPYHNNWRQNFNNTIMDGFTLKTLKKFTSRRGQGLAFKKNGPKTDTFRNGLYS